MVQAETEPEAARGLGDWSRTQMGAVVQAEMEPEAVRGLGDRPRTQMGAVAVEASERMLMVLVWTQEQLWCERDP